MDNPYDPKFWSSQRHKELLKEAQTRRLAKLARTDHRSCSERSPLKRDLCEPGTRIERPYRTDHRAKRRAFALRTKLFAVALILAIPLLLGACTPQIDKPAKGSEVNGAGEVSTSEDMIGATVRIEARGSFVDPESGQQTASNLGGSGFIIDPSGIAVTNNHVVTGSALLQVYVAGEDEPRNAKVLGVSECSDLAVIDIDGEGYPYFKWHDGNINAGLDVYAAGFPSGDSEFTLTRGIISKAEASGETSWASVDSVVEHDATINPGSSGGPLVDNNNKVVGINYSGLSETNQYWAISTEEALKIIGQLREGQDVNSLGVNGEAISEDGGRPGIWVRSVEAESPAGEAGVRAGDFITKLEGLDLATDGTMADYCDIVRTHDPKDIISIEVFRPGTKEVLEGELNGRNLKPAAHTSSAEAGYTKITDESGALVMEVPSGWSDVDGALWAFEGETVGAALRASADLKAYWNTWKEPGVSFAASRTLAQEYSAEEFLDHPNFDYSAECQKDGRDEYDGGAYRGFYDLWTDCGETGAVFITLTAMPQNQEYIMLVQLQVTDQVPERQIKHILSTFEVVSQL